MRLAALLKLRRIENEIDEEMTFHLELLAEENIQQAERATEKVYQRLTAQRGSKPSLTAAENRTAEEIFRVHLYPGGYASILPLNLIHNMKSPLTLLMAMVVLVLVVAAGNVANLLLARTILKAWAFHHEFQKRKLS
jgi:hypothetical protein